MNQSQFPSELRVASLLQYVPRRRATTEADRLSYQITYALKYDHKLGQGTKWVRAVDWAADFLASEAPKTELLSEYFKDAATLVPMPGHAPLVPKRFGPAAWQIRELCELLVERGLGKEARACLVRTKDVPSSSQAASGADRPLPPQHFESLAVDTPLDKPEAITLIDDVITKGSTFVGAVARLQAAWPNVPVRCFAFVRTRPVHEEGMASRGDIFSPVEETVRYEEGLVDRVPVEEG